MSRLIRAGTPVSFNERELGVAAGIATWNTRVNVSRVVAVALASLLVAGIIAGLPMAVNVLLGCALGAAVVVVRALAKTVDDKLEEARPGPGQTDGP